jgi:hypothetical protein
MSHKRDAQAAQDAGKKMDKVIRSLAKVQRTDAKVEFNPNLEMTRCFARYQFVSKRSTKKLQRKLFNKGFHKVMTVTADDADGPLVLSKSVEIKGTRQLAQVAIHVDRIVCKCYVGAPSAAPF